MAYLKSTLIFPFIILVIIFCNYGLANFLNLESDQYLFIKMISIIFLILMYFLNKHKLIKLKYFFLLALIPFYDFLNFGTKSAKYLLYSDIFIQSCLSIFLTIFLLNLYIKNSKFFISYIKLIIFLSFLYLCFLYFINDDNFINKLSLNFLCLYIFIKYNNKIINLPTNSYLNIFLVIFLLISIYLSFSRSIGIFAFIIFFKDLISSNTKKSIIVNFFILIFLFFSLTSSIPILKNNKFYFNKSTSHISFSRFDNINIPKSFDIFNNKTSIVISDDLLSSYVRVFHIINSFKMAIKYPLGQGYFYSSNEVIIDHKNHSNFMIMVQSSGILFLSIFFIILIKLINTYINNKKIFLLLFSPLLINLFFIKFISIFVLLPFLGLFVDISNKKSS
jgi:hypothetical protein